MLTLDRLGGLRYLLRNHSDDTVVNVTAVLTGAEFIGDPPPPSLVGRQEVEVFVLLAGGHPHGTIDLTWVDHQGRPDRTTTTVD